MSFIADSALVSEVCPSPNHGERAGGRKPDMLILHYTGMKGADSALRWLCSPESHVSAHYFVFEDGRVVQMVPEARRAWHAGVSCWAGEQDINSCSIGIEVANEGSEGGLPDYPDIQMRAVARLAGDIVQRNGIARGRVLGHSDVAPERKQDPGPRFDWRLLADHGAGLGIDAAEIRNGPALGPGDEGEEVRALQRDLAAIGYALEIHGRYDDRTRQVVSAFQQHFRQEKVDGICDLSTRETIKVALLED